LFSLNQHHFGSVRWPWFGEAFASVGNPKSKHCFYSGVSFQSGFFDFVKCVGRAVMRYLSGPAYGLLLGERMPRWRSTLNATPDLAASLGSAVISKKRSSVDDRSKEYGGVVLRITEEERAATAAAEQAKYGKLLVDGPVLILPSAGHFNFGFAPNNVVPLPGHGNVYPTFHVSDDRGTLEVEGGALMNDIYTVVTVSTPKNRAGSHIAGGSLEGGLGRRLAYRRGQACRRFHGCEKLRCPAAAGRASQAVKGKVQEGERDCYETLSCVVCQRNTL
jgi:hypothetical protein